MTLSINHEWIPLTNASGDRYHFPEPIKPFRVFCNKPAIYRWVVYKQVPGDLKQLYVGEASLLARRINGYIKPGISQQTNQRMNEIFLGEIAKGHKVTLEYLQFETFTVEDIVITMSDLPDKQIRLLLESYWIIQSKRQGYTVLNA